MNGKPRKRLGELLIEQNLILPEHLEAALIRQKQTGRRLGQVLIEMGLISYEALTPVLSGQTGVPHVWLRKGLVDPKIVGILPREKAEAHGVMPMFKVRQTLTLGMANCDDLFVIDNIENLTGCRVQPVHCRRDDIATAIQQYYGGNIEMRGFLEGFHRNDADGPENRFEDLRMLDENAEGAPVINLVNLILIDAVKAGASDIHIEPDSRGSHVRYRVDGVLKEVMTPRGDLHGAAVSRIKVMSNMDIAEKRVPQDGRMHVRVERRKVDLRVSSMPTVEGEKIVIRLLDKGRLVLDIDRIGFHKETLRTMKGLLRRPHGILLVTGPTGSGKTTTLYCGLAFVNSVEKNIVTIEDPVEYRLEQINQIQVNTEQGLTFARTLRSVLRQDPDIVMVGEIRDRDTAEVAVQAALTGHLVLSTLHTNDSAGAIARLTEMGAEPYLLSSAIIAVLAQRLVRTVCPDCQTDDFPPRETLERIQWKGRDTAFVTGSGCDNCYGTGLRGRTGIYELLVADERVRQAILHDPSADSIRDAGRQGGMRTLRDEAFRLVEERKTSLEEVLRVVFLETQ
ncbi:Flp pilus assembly complex ATPase component TadA [Candidatus Sumerlaeota bacterium]|nr:Flp pilus assembly complex ATPase component TadA [Candidatus Sumerlaeota bacterium]